MKKRIIIFGTGSVAEVLLKYIDLNKVEIVTFVNSNVNVKNFHDYNVTRVEQIHQYVYDYVIVASGYYNQIEKLLLEADVHKEKIIGFIFDEEITYSEIADKIEAFVNERYKREVMNEILIDKTLLPNISSSVIWKNNGLDIIRKDFVREQTLAYIAQEIERKQIKGEVAELGVFKGDFTVVINRLFPRKKLYLFDTFCGFQEADVSADKKVSNKENELLKFQDTSVDIVLSRLNYYEGQCIIKKGWFPDTFDIYDETFCFISIDFNMYNPVYQALELFWERVSEGGYIMVSDFNAPFYEGTRKAIIDFCNKKQVNFLPIPDLYGSIIICR